MPHTQDALIAARAMCENELGRDAWEQVAGAEREVWIRRAWIACKTLHEIGWSASERRAETRGSPDAWRG
jgi:hypothetical protein